MRYGESQTQKRIEVHVYCPKTAQQTTHPRSSWPTWRTFASTPWPSRRACPDPACRAAQSRARAGRPGWDRSAANRPKAAPAGRRSWGVRGGAAAGEKGVCGRDGEAVVGRRARRGRGEGEGGRRRLGDRERGRPLALQDVEADATVAVDVAVVNLRREGHLWRLEGVVGGEVDVQEKDAALIRRLLRAHNGGLPVKEVVAHGARAAGGGRVLGQVLQLLVDALGGSHS
mmetsp:Transcript_11481/g.34269  ORF Transcript_11481/g.34269 Transcript_11481/m.34269 type:complete len:229 (-) Transcript_11481:12-698(-)